MPRSELDEVERIQLEVEKALSDNLDAEALLPLLAKLARAAEPESDAWLYAHRHLAEIGVEHDPWRAALFARRVLACRPEDDGAWAVLGLSQSLLGHYRYAARAYEHALEGSPDNPWYLHNLGHLYDVALDRPADALPLLARACEGQSGEADIAASYAHALARCGRVAAAKRVLKPALRRGGTADQMALYRWIEAGAPADWPPAARDLPGNAAAVETVPEVPPTSSGDLELSVSSVSGEVSGSTSTGTRKTAAAAGARKKTKRRRGSDRGPATD